MSNAAPKYQVRLYAADGANFAPSTLMVDFPYPKNVGWADYLNDVGEAFFSIQQDDPLLDNTALKLALANQNPVWCKVYRTDAANGMVNVHTGLLGEWQANENDIIFISYSLLALAYLISSDWDVEYVNATIATIVTDGLTRMTSGLTSTLSGWLTSGTIENPVTTSGGATGITLPSYKMFYKRTLFMLREMAALGIGNTTNSVVFEITPAGVFNFWKDRSTDRDLTLRYGDGIISGFDQDGVPMLLRTDILGLGMSPTSALLRTEVADASVTTRGRRQEPILLSWVRDSTELSRVIGQRAANALRNDPDLWLRCYPNSLVPPGVTSSLRLSDRIHIEIDRGITQQAAYKQINGHQTLYVGGNERVRLRLADQTGT